VLLWFAVVLAEVAGCLSVWLQFVLFSSLTVNGAIHDVQLCLPKHVRSVCVGRFKCVPMWCLQQALRILLSFTLCHLSALCVCVCVPGFPAL